MGPRDRPLRAPGRVPGPLHAPAPAPARDAQQRPPVEAGQRMARRSAAQTALHTAAWPTCPHLDLAVAPTRHLTLHLSGQGPTVPPLFSAPGTPPTPFPWQTSHPSEPLPASWGHCQTWLQTRAGNTPQGLAACSSPQGPLRAQRVSHSPGGRSSKKAKSWEEALEPLMLPPPHRKMQRELCRDQRPLLPKPLLLPQTTHPSKHRISI